MSTQQRLYRLPLRWNLGSGPTTTLRPNIYGADAIEYTVTDLDDFNTTVDYIEVIGDDGQRYKTPFRTNGRQINGTIRRDNRHVKSVALIKVNDTDYVAVPEYDDHSNGRRRRTGTVSPRRSSNISPRTSTLSPRTSTSSPRRNGTVSNNRLSPRTSTLSPRTSTSSPRRSGTVSRNRISPTRSLNGSDIDRLRLSPRSDTVDIIAFIPDADILERTSDVTRVSANATIPSVDTFADLVQNGPVLLSVRNGSVQVNKLNGSVGQDILQTISNMGSYVLNLLNDAGTNINNLLQPVQEQSQGFINGILTTLGFNNTNT